MRSLSITENRILITVLILVFVVYIASFSGVIGSNDGSHYALVRSLVEHGTFRVNQSLQWTCEDVATDRERFIGVTDESDNLGDPVALPRQKDENFYSNKPPGTAFLAIPFYCLGRWMDPWLQNYPPPATGTAEDRFPHDWFRMEIPFFSEAHKVGFQGSLEDLRRSYIQEWQRQNVVNMLPAILGTLSTWLVIRLSMQLGAGFWPSLVTGFFVALGTIQWRYSTVLFSHIPSTVTLLLLIDGIASGWSQNRKAGMIFWGVLLGFMVAIQYQAALFVPFLVIGWVLKFREKISPWLTPLMLSGSAALMSVVLIASYHQACFGKPWVNPVSRSRYFAYAGRVQEMLSGDPWQAMNDLLIQDSAGPEIVLRASRDTESIPAVATATIQFPLLYESWGWKYADALRKNCVRIFVGSDTQRTGFLQGAGLFLVSPFLLFATFGWIVCVRHSGHIGILIVSLIVLQTGFIAFVRQPTGGATYDARYLMAVIPLWSVGCALLLSRLIPVGTKRKDLDHIQGLTFLRKACQGTGYGIVLITGVLSVTNMLHSMAVFQRHEMALATSRNPFAPGHVFNWQSRFDACFQSIGNWPLWMSVLMVSVLLFLGQKWLVRKKQLLKGS